MRCPGRSAKAATSAAMFAAAVGVVRPGSAGGQEHGGPPVEAALHEVPLARDRPADEAGATDDHSRPHRA
jgi:hypothetical protein